MYLCTFLRPRRQMSYRQNKFNYTNMKKLYSILLLAALCLGGTMQADELGPLYDGTNSSGSSIPVEGNNIDRYQKVQIIYPKADLAALAGKSITKMTFYLKTKAAKEWNAPIQIRLTETDAAQFTTTSYLTSDNWTEVYSGTNLSGKGDVMEVAFANAFVYSGEKNLLFELQVTGTTGTYSSAAFNAKGGYDEYYSIYKYATSGSSEAIATGTRKNVLPKTLFTYEDGAPVTCEKPAGLKEIEVAAKTATLAWNKVNDASWQYICQPAAEEVNWANATTTTDTFAVVNGLTPETNYKFYVRRYCSAEDQSKEVSVAFQTEKSCFAPTSLNVEGADVTTTTAKVTWGASGKGETQWQYTYEVFSDEVPDWTNAVVTDQKEVTLTNLTPKTAYQIWVRSYCADDDQSAAITEYFTTKVDCSAAALPYEDDFSMGIDCWTLTNCHASTNVYEDYYGTTTFRFYYTTTPPQYLISPEFVASAKQVQVEFDYYAYSSSYGESFKVGYSTTDKELASFTWGDEIKTTNTNSSNPDKFSEIFPAGVKFVAIQHTSNNQYYLYIDNFKASEYEAPSCAAPTALTVSEVTAASASVAWESEAETFALQFSTDGLEFADINGVITNPYVLNGLEEQTQYWVRVKAICDESLESEWTEAVAFTTPCAAKAFGYTENFDGENLAACWENKDVHGMNEWSAYENAARYATTSNIANHATLVSPWITIEAEGNPVLFFDWQNTGATAKLSIEADGEAAAELQDLSEPTGESFASFRLYLTEFKGKTVRFLFYGESSAKSKYLYLDNFQVVEKPLLPPTDLKAEAVEGGASVTWKAAWDEVSWAIQVKATAAEDWTAVNAVILEPAYTLTGLDDETEYEVQVQAIYGENQFSAWTESAVFTTPAKTPTAVENAAVKNTATKRIVNGQLIIELGGEQYNAQGVSVK